MTRREFQDGMNSIQVDCEKKEKLLEQLCEKQMQKTDGFSGKQLFYFGKGSDKISFWKLGVPVVAALLACAILVPGVAYADEILNYFRGHLSQNKELAANVNKNVFHDEDNHVSIDVCELVSDSYATCMTVKYTAFDKKGRKWLFDGEVLKDAPPAYRKDKLTLNDVLGIVPCEGESEQELLTGGYAGTQEIVEERTEISRVFSLEYDGDDESNRCLLTYPLSEEKGKKAALDIKNLLKTYTYALTGECSSDTYTPTYLRLSKIRYVVYGENHGIYETHKDQGYTIKMTSDEGINSATLYFKNSSPLDLTKNGPGYFCMGAISPDDDESYNNMDLRVLNGEFYGPDEWIPFEDTEHWYEEEGLQERIEHRLTIDPKDVEKIEINGDVYTLSRVE